MTDFCASGHKKMNMEGGIKDDKCMIYLFNFANDMDITYNALFMCK